MRTIFLLAAFLARLAQAQGYLTYPAGANPNGVIAVDLNGDGKPDLVTANSGSNSLTVLLNNGNGFTPAATVTFSGNLAAMGPQSLAAADLNGDHKMDLVVAGYAGLAVLLGNGDGTFQTPKQAGGQTNDVQVGDLNGDGIPDLVVTELEVSFLIPTAAVLSVLTGNGDGTFHSVGSFSLGLTPWAISTLADLNRDGTLDIAVAVGQRLTVLLNDGKGNFKLATTTQPWNYAAGIATGDFNSDGVVDLAISGQTVAQDGDPGNLGIVATLLGNGDGTLQAAQTVNTFTVGQNVQVADLNHDGHLDLMVGLDPPAFFAGRGDGTFTPARPLGASGSSGFLALGDFSGTGQMGLASTDDFLNLFVLPRVVWPSIAFANVSAAGYGLGPLAPGSIVAAFGSQLASQTLAAPATLPLTLGGDTVSVKGSDGNTLPAQLYYISPSQVNYVIPAGVPAGLATVSITSGGAIAATGQVDIETVAPALFTLNSSYLAAGNLIRVSAGGQQTVQPLFTTDSSGNLAAAPLDLTAASDTFYLSLYGTGMRNLGAAAVSTNFGGTATYVGPQGAYDGLDQVNILLPNSLVLSSSYTLWVRVTVGGQPSNPVTVAIQ